MRVVDAAAGRARLAGSPLRISGAAARGAGIPADAVDGVLAVRLAPGRTLADLAAVSPVALTAASPFWQVPAGHPLSGIHLVFFEGGDDPAVAAAALSVLPEVAYAEPYRVHRTASSPNDPLVPQQEHLDSVDAPAVWDLVRGEDLPVPVAVVDAGIDVDHPDLAANVLLNAADPVNGIDDDGNGLVDDYRGWNFAAGVDDPGALRIATPGSVRHGTHVAGLISAAADNGLDVAGLTWNDPVLCVAVGHPTIENSVIYGYQGIIYAAERGVRVINCSWGRQLTTTRLEVEILEYVGSLGAVVVAAAGNEGQEFPFYPAGYPEVLAVANVDRDGIRHFTSNFGSWIDLAAPGVSLLSLDAGAGVIRLTGTSMSAPLVSSVAALLWGVRPDLTPDALFHRLRVGCAAPPDDGGGALDLGHGLLAAERSLSWTGPGLRIESLGIEDADLDGIVEPGEEILLRPTWINILDGSSGAIEVELTLPDGGGSVLQGSTSLPPIASGGSAAAAGPLRLLAAEDLQPGTDIELLFSWSDAGDPGAYSDFQTAALPGPRLLVDLTGGEIRFTLGGNGRIGFIGRGGGDGQDGIGVNYVPVGSQHGAAGVPGLLFEGAWMVAAGPDRISDAARYALQGSYHRYWNPESAADLPRRLPDFQLDGGTSLTAARSCATDAAAPDPMGLRAISTALVPDPGDIQGTGLVMVVLRNDGVEDLTGLRAGFFLDWDLGTGSPFPSFGPNSTALDPASGLALTWRDDSPDCLTVATALVAESDAPTRARAIDNAAGEDWNIYDGFTAEEKWDALAGESFPTAAGGSDVSQVVAVGPFDLAPGDSLGCLLLTSAGLSRDEALANGSAGLGLAAAVLAERRWDYAFVPQVVGAPRPNPSTGFFAVDVSGIRLAPWNVMVYDLRGRLVWSGVSDFAGDQGIVTWPGIRRDGSRAPSGVYLLSIGQQSRRQVRKILLLR